MKAWILSLLFWLCSPIYAQIGPNPISDLNTWQAIASYSQGQTVIRWGTIYRSLINSNQGNDPPGSPSDWTTQFGGIAGNTYYLSPTGLDSNSGTTPSSPWLTPNHSLNCGDTISAAVGTYAASSFNATFGTVACAAGNNVAWLKCTIFDACKISANGDNSALAVISVNKSYWGVQGWEVTDTNDPYVSCFGAFPDPNTTVQIHHIIFANNVANGCQGGGIGAANESHLVGVDYLAIIGNIVYNAAQGNGECFSGISIYQPVASDTLPGTHLYIAGNFSWGNVEPNPCAGGTPTDGEGIALDTLNGLQTSGLPAYSQQVLVDNNISVFNGASGISLSGSGNSSAAVYIRHNTAYGNFTDTNQDQSTTCGQFNISGFPASAPNIVNFTNVFDNLSVPSGNTEPGCGSNPAYAYTMYNGTSSDQVYSNFGYSAAGNNTLATSSTGFTFGPNNTFGTSPSFASAANPSAPSCGSSSSVPACMTTVIANFTPTNATAKGLGYQIPSPVISYDPLFPQWLCGTNLPSGLVTMGCVSII